VDTNAGTISDSYRTGNVVSGTTAVGVLVGTK